MFHWPSQSRPSSIPILARGLECGKSCQANDPDVEIYLAGSDYKWIGHPAATGTHPSSGTCDLTTINSVGEAAGILGTVLLARSASVIDDLKQVSRLLVKLERSPPLAVTLRAQAVVSLNGHRFGAEAPTQYQVTAVYFLGHQDGIVCRLNDMTGKVRGEFLASITHLEFDQRQPIARDIVTYQRHRMERLRRAASHERHLVAAN
jgi:hypothetical protein